MLMRFVETIVKFNKRNNNGIIMIKLGGLIDLKPITEEADVFTATSKDVQLLYSNQKRR